MCLLTASDINWTSVISNEEDYHVYLTSKWNWINLPERQAFQFKENNLVSYINLIIETP